MKFETKLYSAEPKAEENIINSKEESVMTTDDLETTVEDEEESVGTIAETFSKPFYVAFAVALRSGYGGNAHKIYLKSLKRLKEEFSDEEIKDCWNKGVEKAKALYDSVKKVTPMPVMPDYDDLFSELDESFFSFEDELAMIKISDLFSEFSKTHLVFSTTMIHQVYLLEQHYLMIGPREIRTPSISMQARQE